MSKQLKLYMPITVISYKNNQIKKENSIILEEYIPEIRDRLKNIMEQWDLNYGKSQWYEIPSPLKDFVSSYYLDVEKVEDSVFAVGKISIKKSLNSKELVRGEAANGIGELLEYEVFSTKFGVLELHFWEDEGWWLGEEKR